VSQTQRDRIATEAARNNLGTSGGVYRSRRTTAPRTVWWLAGSAAAVTLFAFAAGVGLLAVVAGPLTLLGILGYVFLLPPGGGRRWVGVYEHGLVELSHEHRWPVAVRWENVRSVVHESEPERMLVAFEPLGDDPTVVLSITGYGRRADLVATIERYVQPLLLARARAALRDEGRASFGPLAVTPEGLVRALPGVPGASTVDLLPWELIAAHELVGNGRIRVVQRGSFAPWFFGPVPDAIAADRLIDETDPNGVVGPEESFVDAGLAKASSDAQDRQRRYRQTVAVLAALALVPATAYAANAAVADHPASVAASPSATTVVVTPTTPWTPPPPTQAALPTPTGPGPLPTAVTGYFIMCSSNPPAGYQGAPAYAGPGPHPTAFSGDYDFVKDLPAGWNAPDASTVQLVACIDSGTDGSFIQNCRYSTDEGTKTSRLLWGTFTIRLYEASTARLVATATVRGSANQCDEIVLASKGQPLADQYSRLTAADIRRAIGKYVQ